MGVSIKGSTEAQVTAPADAVFGALTDVRRLPEWNTIIKEVVEAPEKLEPGASWLVQIRAMGSGWKSRSTVEEYDAAKRVFAYKSQTDDGNPSKALWRWEVDDAGDGSRVRVSWDVQPVTFWRRTLLARIRARQLAKEVPASVDALARVASASPATG